MTRPIRSKSRVISLAKESVQVSNCNRRLRFWGHALIEFALGSRLFGANTSRSDVGAVVVFAFHRRAGQSAEHGELPNVSQGICQRALKQLFRRRGQNFAGREIGVERPERSKKPSHLVVPRQWLGVLPGLLALGDRERPVEEVADVRENPLRRAGCVPRRKTGKGGRRTAYGFPSPIGDGGDDVAQQLTFGVHRRCQSPGVSGLKMRLQQVTAPSALAISLTSTAVTSYPRS